MIDFNTTIDGLNALPQFPRDIQAILSLIPRDPPSNGHLLLTLRPNAAPDLCHAILFDRPMSARKVRDVVAEGIAKTRWLADLYRPGARSA